MIVTVTPNPAVDVTIQVDDLHPGATHVITPARSRAGGKGLNVARVLAQTGYNALALGPVGAEEADWFAGDLPGVQVRLTGCAAGARHTYALVETAAGRTSQLNEQGPARTDAEWDRLIDEVTDTSAGARCVSVSGSLPPHAPGDLIARIIAAAHAEGTPVIADVTGPALRQAAACGAEVLKPNRDELATTVRTDDARAGARALVEAGAGLVVVSLGEDGMLAVPAAGPAVHAGLDRVLHGNPTGAGDAAVAALAAVYDDGADPADDLPDSLTRAVAWSAAAVLAPQAGTLDPAHGELAAHVRVRTV